MTSVADPVHSACYVIVTPQQGLLKMLVLSRKKNEAIRIGDDITIVITDIGKNKVGIAIDAPKSLKILREELLPLTKVQTCQQ